MAAPSLPNTLAEFQTLSRDRDQAAHTVVLVVQVVLGFWEAQDFEVSRRRLQDALDLYREADRRLSQFAQPHPPDNPKPANSQPHSAAQEAA
jgi:hypothetical protein